MTLCIILFCTDIITSSSDNQCILTASVSSIVCSLVFLLTGGVAGGLLGHIITAHRKRNKLAGNQPPPAPVYEELPADSMSRNPVYGIATTGIELENNEAYGRINDSV